MTVTMTVQIDERVRQRIERLAGDKHRKPDEIAAMLLDEASRMAIHPQIDFRDVGAGRIAYVKGSSLGVWRVIDLARSYDSDLDKVAEHLVWPRNRVFAAMRYAEDFPEEIEKLIQKSASMTFEQMSQRFPSIRRVTVDGDNDEANE